MHCKRWTSIGALAESGGFGYNPAVSSRRLTSQPHKESRGNYMVEAGKAAEPIWFFPHKFWAATRNMPKEQADKLLDEVISLSEVRDLEALRKYDFVSLENPYRKKAVA